MDIGPREMWACQKEKEVVELTPSFLKELSGWSNRFNRFETGPISRRSKKGNEIGKPSGLRFDRFTGPTVGLIGSRPVQLIDSPKRGIGPKNPLAIQLVVRSSF